jgi:hypothetical protein
VALSDGRWGELLEIRATDPAAVSRAWAARRRRPLLGPDGRLFLLAADHPARSALAVGGDPLAMADRRDLLDRLLVALSVPGVDGLLGSPDVLEELLLLDALEGRVVVGTMNRAGLAGSVWELDDRMTAYDPATLESAGLDGGKMLLRIDPADAGSLPTIEVCARAVGQLASAGLMAMIEPLPYTSDESGRARFDPDPDALIRVIGVASALGPTSAHTWLKLPATDDVERVMSATTLPALILGGAPGPDPETAFAAWERALAVPQVRGLVVGRTLLYPPDGDVKAAVETAAGIVR